MNLFSNILCNNAGKVPVTVLPAKSESDVMFCLQSYQRLLVIDHLCLSIHVS